MEQEFGKYPLNNKGLRYLQRETDAIRRKIRREFGIPPETSGLSEVQIKTLQDQIVATDFDHEMKQQMFECVNGLGLLDKQTQIQLFQLTNSMDYVDKPRQHAYITQKYTEIEQEKRRQSQGKNQPFDLSSYNEEIQQKTKDRFTLDQDDMDRITAIISEGTIYGYPKQLLNEKIRNDETLSAEEKKNLLETIGSVSQKITHNKLLDNKAKAWLMQKTEALCVNDNVMSQFKTRIQMFMESEIWKVRIEERLYDNFIPEEERPEITKKINAVTEKTMLDYAHSLLLQAAIPDKAEADKVLLIDSLNHSILRQYMAETIEVTAKFKPEDAYLLSSKMIGGVVGMTSAIFPEVKFSVNPQVGLSRRPLQQRVSIIENHQKQTIKPDFAERYRRTSPSTLCSER